MTWNIGDLLLLKFDWHLFDTDWLNKKKTAVGPFFQRVRCLFLCCYLGEFCLRHWNQKTKGALGRPRNNCITCKSIQVNTQSQQMDHCGFWCLFGSRCVQHNLDTIWEQCGTPHPTDKPYENTRTNTSSNLLLMSLYFGDCLLVGHLSFCCFLHWNWFAWFAELICRSL